MVQPGPRSRPARTMAGMKHLASISRRHALCCGAAAVAGLFSALLPAADAAPMHPLAEQALQGLDPTALWDVHAHLLGTGDAGSGCRIHAHMGQWWHPLEVLRKRVVLGAAGVDAQAASIDRAFVQRLLHLAQGFPEGARWLLLAFDAALDDRGQERPEWTTFHVPDAYARQVAQAHPRRFGWVASIHPYRPDALARLDAALGAGALAVKWLPGAMNIDLRDRRLRPFYARLAASRRPLLVHCGEEKAVPGAGRHDLGNPLLVREPLRHGVRVIVAHCASLGDALDLDRRRPHAVPAFELFARLMDEPAWQGLLLGDVSAVFQANRHVEHQRQLLTRQDWHPRLLHGSDHPLPGLGPLYRPATLARAGLLAEADVPGLAELRQANPLLFHLVLERRLRWQGQRLGDEVFHTRRHFS